MNPIENPVEARRDAAAVLGAVGAVAVAPAVLLAVDAFAGSAEALVWALVVGTPGGGLLLAGALLRQGHRAALPAGWAAAGLLGAAAVLTAGVGAAVLLDGGVMLVFLGLYLLVCAVMVAWHLRRGGPAADARPGGFEVLPPKPAEPAEPPGLNGHAHAGGRLRP